MSWPTKKLGEVATVESGGTPRRSNPNYFRGKTPFVKIGDMLNDPISNTEETITEGGLKNSAAKLWKKGTILFSIFATLGRVSELKIDAASNQAIAGIFNIKQGVEPRYLKYFLGKIGPILALRGRGVAQNNLNLSILKKLEIPIPPPKIQKQIVERMDKIAEAQKLNNELIQKSDELFQSLLHKEFSPAGRNWEVKKLGEVAEVKGGKRIPKGMNFSSERTSHPYLRVVDFMDGSIRIENLKYISDGIFKFIKNYTISPKDIYISIAGTIGLVGKIPEILDGASLTENAAKILVDENKIDQDYLVFALNTIQSKKQIEKFTQAVGVPKLALERIKKIQISIPSLEKQKQIVEKLSAVQSYKKGLVEQKAKLKELFDSVLQRSMNGEIN